MKDYVVEINNQSLIKQKDYAKAIKKGYWDGEIKYCNEITDEWLGKKIIKLIGLLSIRKKNGLDIKEIVIILMVRVSLIALKMEKKS